MTHFDIEAPKTTMSKDGVVVKDETPEMTDDEIRTGATESMDRHQGKVPQAVFWQDIGIGSYDRRSRAAAKRIMDELGIVVGKGRTFVYEGDE
jgi:hypothetical protein